MHKKTLSILLVMLATCFFTILAFVFYYVVLEKNTGGPNSQQTNYSRNIVSLKSMENFTGILVLKAVDKENGFISLQSSSEKVSQEFKVDKDTILICLEDPQSLEVNIDFSRLDIWSSDLNKFMSQKEGFYENIIGKNVRLVLMSDYVSAIMIGGCQ